MKIGKYSIMKLLGDGTFGRVLLGELEGRNYALKVIRPVARYIRSAKIEVEVLQDLYAKNPSVKGVVKLRESFSFVNELTGIKHFCIVFDPLGESLYDFIKMNKYRGFPIQTIKKFSKELLTALYNIHSLSLTHTDLKPENILFSTGSNYKLVENQKDYPPQVILKKDIFGSHFASGMSSILSEPYLIP